MKTNFKVPLDKHENVEQVIRYYLSFLPPRGCKNVIDIGCGRSAPYRGMLAARTGSYLSVDIREGDKVDVVCDIMKDDHFKEDQFQWGWCVEVLEHIPQDQQWKFFSIILNFCENLIITFPTPKHETFYLDPGHNEVVLTVEKIKAKYPNLFIYDKSTKTGRNIWVFCKYNAMTIEVNKMSIKYANMNKKSRKK